MSKQAAKKVVVTGGAGFIGSHLSGELNKRGYHVVVIDDLSTGKRKNLSEYQGLEFHEGSVTDIDLLNELFKDALYVFHLAALASVPLSLEDPLKCHEINATGTLKVLSAARETSVSKVISISSCAVYGDTEIVPIPETAPTNPLSPYAAAKLVGEQYCRIFNQLFGLPTVSMRLFNVFGPRQDPDSPYSAAIPIFIKGISEGKRPIIFGDGEQTRDFLYVDDTVAACILAAETDITGEYNVGSGTSITVNRLVRMISSILGFDPEPEYCESRPGDIRFSSPDISRIQAIGYQPQYGLEQGLKSTIDAVTSL
ncbi:MAG: NAD-dependent epimerase/dehydratase family protein [Dehalococcoidales bacterium]|nr:NAD-dependent epimerase/dehydratase family protein [Dehalococcoidales bacterium]